MKLNLSGAIMLKVTRVDLANVLGMKLTSFLHKVINTLDMIWIRSKSISDRRETINVSKPTLKRKPCSLESAKSQKSNRNGNGDSLTKPTCGTGLDMA